MTVGLSSGLVGSSLRVVSVTMKLFGGTTRPESRERTIGGQSGRKCLLHIDDMTANVAPVEAQVSEASTRWPLSMI